MNNAKNEELEERLNNWRKLALKFDEQRMSAIWILKRLKFLSQRLANDYRSGADSGDWGGFVGDDIQELVDLEKFLKTVEEFIPVDNEAKYKEALIAISNIQNELFGDDWEEIEQARKIALEALKDE